jgi:hypothetical protein
MSPANRKCRLRRLNNRLKRLTVAQNQEVHFSGQALGKEQPHFGFVASGL